MTKAVPGSGARNEAGMTADKQSITGVQAAGAAETPHAGCVLAAVRVLLGLLWLQGAGWKVPPDFAGVATFVQKGIDDPVLPPYSWVLQHVIQPHMGFFGWITLLTELSLAVFLLTGLATRLFAAVGVVQSAAIGLTVASAPGEWGWAYWLMIAAHLAVLASPAAGRIGGLDGSVRGWVPASNRLGGLYLRWAS